MLMAWLKLIRIKNLLLISISQILIVCFLFSYHQLTPVVYLYLFCTFCLAAAGNIINDYFDVTTDATNKPSKQIVGKHILPKNAFGAYIIFNLLGLIAGTYACILLQSVLLYFYGIPVILLLYLYSKQLKGIPFLGNFIIASFTAFSILFFLMIIPSNPYQKQIIYILAFFAFALNLIREIIKDIEDVKGDKKANLKTLPIIIGTTRTVAICKFLIIVTLISFVILLYVTNTIYVKLYILITLTIPLAYCFQLLKSAVKKNDFSRISGILKLIIGFGILAVFFA